MALPRVKPSFASNLKTVDSFPEYVNAKTKLADLEQQLAESRLELRAASEAPREAAEERTRQRAEAILNGVAIAEPPSIVELTATMEALREAVRIQKEETERQREIAAREISAEALPIHRGAIADFVRLQTAALDAYATIASIEADARRACEGTSFLPDLAINPARLAHFRDAFGTYRSIVSGYIG